MKCGGLSICILGLLLLLPGGRVRGAETGAPGFLQSDMRKAEQLVHTVPVAEILGPLAPIALSPFFGLTCLSGTSILVNQEVLPGNAFLTGNEALNNPYVFFALLALTLLTSLPKLTKVSKLFAQAVDQVEAYAGFVAFVVVVYFSQFGSPPATASETIYTAGVFSFSMQTLLLAAAAVNMLVINSVKYFFELLVFISPIPLVDALFEGMNKLLVAGLVLIYALSPWLAFALNAVIFLFCLVLFRWARRRVRYYRDILIAPLWASAVSRLGGAQTVNLTPCRVPHRIRHQLPDIQYALRVYPETALGDFDKLDQCYLVRCGKKLILARARTLRDPVLLPLDRDILRVAVERRLLTNALYFYERNDEALYTLIFSRIYNPSIAELARAFDAELREKAPFTEAADRQGSWSALLRLGRQAGLKQELKGG